jgi:SAM-dependent methyltransferase
VLKEQASPVERKTPTQMDFRFLVHLAHMGATDIHPMGSAATRALIAQLELHPGQAVLEVGCGTGGTMTRLAQYGLARIDGVDAIPARLRMARRRLRLAGKGRRSSLHLVEPGGPLPFPNACYDRVYTESVLGFQDEQGAHILLAEVFRVLKPGGRYVANEAIWKAGVPAERIASLNAACLADFGVRVASAAPWILDDWLRIMEEAGFQVIRAALVDEHLTADGVERTPLRLHILLSSALTRFSKLFTVLTPAGRRARANYRNLLKQRHQDDGLFIEPRLFVLQKPSPFELGKND